MRAMRLTARTVLAVLGATAALSVAGCGGSGSGTSLTASSVPDTASLGPADAALWISVDTDRGSAQWQALDAALGRIPGAEQALNRALAQIGSGDRKLDFQTDVLPALGNEVVAVLRSGASDPVLLVKPADDAKLKALLAGSATPPVTGTQDGWTVIAAKQQELDAYEAALARGTLAASDAFAQAMNPLPRVALARVYVDAKGLGAALTKAAGAASGALGSLSIPGLASPPATGGSVGKDALAQAGTAGLAVSVDGDVVRVDGSLTAAASSAAATYAPTLLDRVPADALAALSFSGTKAAADRVRQQLAAAGAGSEALKQIEQTLGVSLDQLIGVADGQGVAYVRPGLILPEVTVVLEPSDPAAALQTIAAAAAKLAARAGAAVGDETVGAVHWREVHVSVVTVAWGRDGDRVVVTTTPAAVADFDGGDAKLVDTDRFRKAAADVGLGDRTSGFAYVDVHGLAPLVSTLASTAGSGSQASAKQLAAALEAIDTVALGSSVDAGRVDFQAALRVR
jgi:uncharacterized protein DUF3352